MKNNCTICSLNSIVQVCLTSFSLFKSDNIVLFLFSIEIQDGTYFKKKKQELNSGLKKKITCFKKGISLKKIVQEKLIQILWLKKLGFFFYIFSYNSFSPSMPVGQFIGPKPFSNVFRSFSFSKF